MDSKNLDSLKFPSGNYITRLSAKFKNRIPYQPANPMNIMSFIPGTIMEILVRPGQLVEKGDDLIILEAMKMQNRLKSHVKGTIKRICVERGNKVSKGIVLIEIE
jgi:biotin carboxyl carrier protein